MKTLIDVRVKKHLSVPDFFIRLPDKPGAKQAQALADLRKLLKYELKEKSDAETA